MNSAEDHQEIIIIKRHGEHEDGHHGGAWKIAFADFMTAMMALFLVLWLVNAANEETKKAVASYFNPVKLVDRNRSVRGLYDAQGMQEIEQERKADDLSNAGESPEAGGYDGEAADAGAAGTSDEEFFADPYAALDEIVEASAAAAASEAEASGGGAVADWRVSADGAEAESFLDPFAPERWSEARRDEEVMADIPLSGANDMGELGGTEPTEEVASSETADDGELGSVALTPQMREALGIDATGELIDGADATLKETPMDVADASDAMDPPVETDDRLDAAEVTAEELREEVSEALREAFGADSALPEQLTIEPQEGMVLISVTDNLEIPMFGIGSAVPSGPLVVALERIGSVVSTRPGGVQIEGHTDARPFRSGESDNWQLSSARAQSAFYMLVRGGLDEQRVRKVSGLADRDLADPNDPLSSVNRRIDILLEVDATP